MTDSPRYKLFFAVLFALLPGAQCRPIEGSSVLGSDTYYLHKLHAANMLHYCKAHPYLTLFSSEPMSLARDTQRINEFRVCVNFNKNNSHMYLYNLVYIFRRRTTVYNIGYKITILAFHINICHQ